MKQNKYSSLTLKVQLGDLEIYTASDMGFVGDFAVTPKIHSHPYHEIIAVIDGKLKIDLLDNEDIEVERGELCIVPPKCYHSTCAGDRSVKMLAIRFAYGRVKENGQLYHRFRSALERIAKPTCLDMPENISRTLLELKKEMTEKNSAWDYMCESLLQRIYIEVFRMLSKDNKEDGCYTEFDSKHSRYFRIEMWFANNFAKQITEDELAREVAISKRHLSRVLNDIYGMSFKEKLIEVRLHRAAQLLEQTELNTAKIASAVGYRSFSGFHRAFVKCFGCTPFEYRKNNMFERNRNGY